VSILLDDGDIRERQERKSPRKLGIFGRFGLALDMLLPGETEVRGLTKECPMRRLLSISVVALVLGVVATPVASAQQTVNLFIGGFTPRSLDGRGTDDVLFQNGAFLSTLDSSSGINISRFNNVTVGGEYLVGLTPNVEAGLGLGFYQKSVPTVFTSLVNADGPRSPRASSCASSRSPRRCDWRRSGSKVRFSRMSAPASACSSGATAKRGSSSTARTTSSSATSSRAAARRVPSFSAGSGSASAG
jgi:hypothetical protein